MGGTERVDRGQGLDQREVSGTVAVLAVAGDRGIWCAAWHPS